MSNEKEKILSAKTCNQQKEDFSIETAIQNIFSYFDKKNKQKYEFIDKHAIEFIRKELRLSQRSGMELPTFQLMVELYCKGFHHADYTAHIIDVIQRELDRRESKQSAIKIDVLETMEEFIGKDYAGAIAKKVDEITGNSFLDDVLGAIILADSANNYTRTDILLAIGKELAIRLDCVV